MDERKDGEQQSEDAPGSEIQGNSKSEWRGSQSTAPGSLDLPAAIAQVGEPIEVFRCVNTLLLLWAFGGILFMVGGTTLTIALAYLVIARQQFDIRMIQVIMMPVGIWLGWITTRSALGRMGSRVLLCERGFIYQHRNGVTVFPWNEITEVRYDDDTATPGPSGFPRVRMATEFTVVRADETTFPFSLYNLL
jgi:hypothetical protein